MRPEQAAQHLQQSVLPRSIWFPFWSRRTNGFEGTVFGDRFSINRAIRYRNSFLPVLHGRFLPNGAETLVDVRMIMHPFVIVFLVVWYGILFRGVVILFAYGFPGKLFGEQLGLATLMILLSYLLIFVAFGFEAQKATRMLNEIFA
jgi:hypothetical protein